LEFVVNEGITTYTGNILVIEVQIPGGYDALAVIVEGRKSCTGLLAKILGKQPLSVRRYGRRNVRYIFVKYIVGM
jgi:hypothetical protein